ncbi:ABC transporter permease [Lysobacteraceae bacterium NML95-0200]|nr:ABC transporter permease [Xanthomonadaceae bacterium NML95-0200]
MKTFLRRSALLLALALPFGAQAHKVWMRPSQTVVSGNAPWVTVDAAVSNDLFYFNHVPLRTDGLIITAPDGSVVQAQNLATGKYRSVFDVELNQPGTWRLAAVNDGIMASWKENGQNKRWRGTAERFAAEVPANAQELRVNEGISRIETFVTRDAPNDTALKISGRGLEMQPITHPNDLFAGEEARFRLLIDGQPAAGVELEIIRGETRYRNAQDEIKLKTDARGEFKVSWPSAGMYWLEATSRDDKTRIKQASQRRLTYVATLEVLPQ